LAFKKITVYLPERNNAVMVVAMAVACPVSAWLLFFAAHLEIPLGSWQDMG